MKLVTRYILLPLRIFFKELTVKPLLCIDNGKYTIRRYGINFENFAFTFSTFFIAHCKVWIDTFRWDWIILFVRQDRLRRSGMLRLVLFYLQPLMKTELIYVHCSPVSRWFSCRGEIVVVSLYSLYKGCWGVALWATTFSPVTKSLICEIISGFCLHFVSIDYQLAPCFKI